MDSQRLRRVNDLLQRVLAEMVGDKLQDPRLGFVTITGVETSADLRHARVNVSVLGPRETQRTSLEVLNHAKGFLRAELRHEVPDLRVLPELQFVFDPTIEHANRIERLLREAKGEGDEPETAPAPSAADALRPVADPAGLDRAAAEIAPGRRYLLATHVNPDGDTLGSMLALGLVLRERGDDVTMVSPGVIPDIYDFLPGVGDVISEPDPAHVADVGVVFDCDQLHRVGEPLAAAITRCPVVVDVDHHPSPPFGTHPVHDTRAAATGELVWRLLDAMDAPPQPDVATCLLTAIMTDTGRFLYPNTTPDTYRIAAELLAAGADHESIAENVYQSRPHDTSRLLGRALSALRLTAGGRVAWSALTQRDFADEGAGDIATEGLVSFVAGVRGVLLAALLREVEPGVVRVSLRSRCDISIREVAQRFGGGGHPRASGCTLTSSIEEAQADVVAALVALIPPADGAS